MNAPATRAQLRRSDGALFATIAEAMALLAFLGMIALFAALGSGA